MGKSWGLWGVCTSHDNDLTGDVKPSSVCFSSLCKVGMLLPWVGGWLMCFGSWGMRIYELLSVYLLKPCLYSFTNGPSVFSTKQAVHIYCDLTIYVISESLVHHFELKQCQPMRVLRANRVPSSLPSALSFLSSPTDGRIFSILDSDIYHFSVQESVIHS